jgi:hypothetical protein
MTTRKAPKYCQGFVDRHGKARWYFRRRGSPRVPLPGLPWSSEFMAAYEAAVARDSMPKDKVIRERQTSGVVATLVVLLEFT